MPSEEGHMQSKKQICCLYDMELLGPFAQPTFYRIPGYVKLTVTQRPICSYQSLTLADYATVSRKRDKRIMKYIVYMLI